MLLTMSGELPELPMDSIVVAVVPARTPPNCSRLLLRVMIRVGGDITIAAALPLAPDVSWIVVTVAFVAVFSTRICVPPPR